jgi:hypothetical protein
VWPSQTFEMQGICTLAADVCLPISALAVVSTWYQDGGPSGQLHLPAKVSGVTALRSPNALSVRINAAS